MRRPLMLLMAILASLLIAGCGSSGHSADPPTGGVVAVPGDGIVTVSWAMESGVDYWMFYAPASSISTSNWTAIAGSKSVIDVFSPFLATDLSNGTVYSFTLNGRTNGGPGGPGTPSVSATPRLAGTATAALTAPWTAGTAIGAGANNLLGLVRGTQFVAVGAGGIMYSSPDGVAWTKITSPVASDLNAAAYSGIYTAVGDSGVILYSTDAITWTAAASSGTVTTKKLNGIAAGVDMLVAVGAGGTIIKSADGINWTAAASSGTVTPNDLYAVTSYGSSLWIAVGDKGTLLTSADANTWTSRSSTPVTLLNLKGVTYGRNAATGAVVLMAVGASGALLTSSDAITWTTQPAIGTGASNLSAVNYGTQFIAVGSGGGIFTSTDGTTWAGPQPVPSSAAGSNLNAIAHAPYSYSVVGAAGVNLLAK